MRIRVLLGDGKVLRVVIDRRPEAPGTALAKCVFGLEDGHVRQDELLPDADLRTLGLHRFHHGVAEFSGVLVPAKNLRVDSNCEVVETVRMLWGFSGENQAFCSL